MTDTSQEAAIGCTGKYGNAFRGLVVETGRRWECNIARLCSVTLVTGLCQWIVRLRTVTMCGCGLYSDG
jgi:hypothetical protein